MSSRRAALAGLIALASLPALAQNQNQAIPFSVTPQPTETDPAQGLGSRAQERQQRTRQGGAPQDTRTPERQGAASAPAGLGQQQSQADRLYVQEALALSTVSLQQSNFALSKALHPRVKLFAQFETEEQTTLTDVLHSFADPSATGSTTSGAQQAASTAPELSQQDSAAMERLSRAQGGAAFDRDYVALQIEAHRRLLALQDRYLQNASNNREMMNVARLARARIGEHLALLSTIQATIQAELGR